MIIIKTIKDFRNLHLSGKLGFIPTMGHLHEGHLSLITKAQEDCNTIIVSIFVNPTQFDDGEDLDTYPRTLEEDIKILDKVKPDILFLPVYKEIYPNKPKKIQFPSFNKLASKLCGISRPNHFSGVCMVVHRLLNILHPEIAYFGLKDYQQYMIIKKMVKELNLNTKIVGCPTIRENDGLAMSSRNSYLSPNLRIKATSISKSLRLAQNSIKQGETNPVTIKNLITKKITASRIDYLEIIDRETLETIDKIKNNSIIAVAAHFGNTRLIDNILIK